LLIGDPKVPNMPSHEKAPSGPFSYGPVQARVLAHAILSRAAQDEEPE
jgi:hypothetical protein